jgi:two-component system response regulator LytT
MTKLRCIAVDDEPLALKLVSNFVSQTPFLELVTACASAVEALQIIHSEQVDLLFLDIQMADLNGMELARVISQTAGRQPRIIFTTAYNHFAIDGYKVDAIDYLLKPFNYEEFLRAAEKARRTIASTESSMPAAAPEPALFIKVEYQWVRVDYHEILYVEGLKDYVKLHLEEPKKSLMSLTTLKTLEDRLPTAHFLRVHRSFIVALDKITAITKTSLRIGEAEIPVGDQYREAFREITRRWLL